MKSFRTWLFVCLLTCVGLTTLHFAQQQPQQPPASPLMPPPPPNAPRPAKRDVGKMYTELCASCHGPTMTGAQAPSLVDSTWKYGGDDASIATSIRDGRLDAGMPPLGKALNDEEIRALVIFIREAGARYARSNATYAKPELAAVVQSEKHAFKLEPVVESGLETPWSVAFLPDGRLLVTEKPGRLRIVENGKLLPAAVTGTPAVFSNGQGGLLDVAVHPDYAKADNGWIYLSYSDPGPDGSAMTAIVRGRLKDGAFVDQQQLWKADTSLYRTGGVHFGSRFVFDGKGHLYFSIGERGRGPDAQDITRPNGKVHRIHDDGRIPADNPFASKEGAIKSIWSYGNRNPQGLSQHPVTGDLWEVEHGPRGGDELNRILPGRNYGWNVITYGMNYDGTPMVESTAKDGMEQPVTHWTPSIAVCPIDFYTGSKFPEWKNNLFVGALAQQEVRRVVIDEQNAVTHQEVLFKDIGRVRDLVSAPDGNIYVVFNQPDRVARIVPASGGSTSGSAAR